VGEDAGCELAARAGRVLERIAAAVAVGADAIVRLEPGVPVGAQNSAHRAAELTPLGEGVVQPVLHLLRAQDWRRTSPARSFGVEDVDGEPPAAALSPLAQRPRLVSPLVACQ
jgi:hypothetical protein